MFNFASDSSHQGRFGPCRPEPLTLSTVTTAVQPSEPVLRPPAPGAARPAPGPAADEGLARRLKALACTAPLHDRENRKVYLAGE